MSVIAAAAQVAIALGIFNVWILRRNRATAYRPDGASNIDEEFQRYGLPSWAPTVVGSTKLGLAALLLVGLAFPQVVVPAASFMGVLMIGAVLAHVRVRDPLVKAAPAFIMLVLSTIVVASYVA